MSEYKGLRDLRGKEFPDLKEKRLLVARYFLRKQVNNEPFEEKDIFYLWQNYYTNDFKISRNHKLYFQTEKSSRYKLMPKVKSFPEDIIKNYNHKWENIYKWMMEYLSKKTLEDNYHELEELKKQHLKDMIHTFKPLHYYVKDTKHKIVYYKIAKYSVHTKDIHKSGTYSELMKYAEELKNNKRSNT